MWILFSSRPGRITVCYFHTAEGTFSQFSSVQFSSVQFSQFLTETHAPIRPEWVHEFLLETELN